VTLEVCDSFPQQAVYTAGRHCSVHAILIVAYVFAMITYCRKIT
jgi:hypothetical protein